MREIDVASPSDLLGTSEPAVGNIDALAFALDLDRTVAAGSRAVPRGCPLLVTGWALDAGRTRGAEVVVVTVGGTAAADAVTALSREDVARTFGLESVRTSGFFARVATDSLPPGQYEVGFRVIDRANASYAAWNGSVTFEVSAGTKTHPRLARGRIVFSIGAPAIERPPILNRSSTSALNDCAITVTGWAVDAKLTAVAGGVYAMVDQHIVERGLYGFASEEAVVRFETATLSNAGFRVRLARRDLAPGAHRLRILATTADGSLYDESEELQFDVVDSPTPPRNAGLTARAGRGLIERTCIVRDGQIAACEEPRRIERGRTVHVSGWAADERGAGTAAALLVDERRIFAARYGAERADVAAALGDPEMVSCGFVGAISTGDLELGAHLVRCILRVQNGTSWIAATEPVPFEITADGSAADLRRTEHRRS